MQAGTAFAQFLDQGAVTGIVKDPSGAVIPGAKVTLTDTDTGLILHGKTNGSGLYIFSPINIGHYTVRISAPGFQTTTHENIDVELGARLSVPITLQPGSVRQTITVTSAPPLLQTQQGSVGQVLTSQQITNTPLNGRNAIFMAQLTPGAVPALGGRGKGSGDFSANGLRPEQNNFVLDGMANNALSADVLGGSSFLVNPPPDALAQFKVSTANYSAEFGHSAGAVVDASIKSGTNNIHGSLWEYWRNDVLDARDFDAKTVPEFRENLFGATLGLPIFKDRLFFFGDVQANRIVSQQPHTQSVPTQKERSGDFSELLDPTLTGSSKPITLYEPNSGGNTKLTCNGQQNVYCPNQINPVAEHILSLYPLPNANGGKTFANNVQNLSQPQNTFQWDVRVDWNVSSRDRAFARFSYANQLANFAGPLGPILDGGAGNGAPSVSGQQINFGNNFVFSETHVFSPTLVNEFRFGYNYGHFGIVQPNSQVNIAATLGLGGVPFGPEFPSNGGLPVLNISSIAAAGSHQFRPELEKENEYQILDNLEETLGRHSIKFGISLQSLRMYVLEPPQSHGNYSFSGFFTGANGKALTGNGVADFLANQMDGGTVSPMSPYNDFSWVISGYGEDNWRITSALTLNLGLRYDWYQPHQEMQNRQASFFPNGTPGISTGSGTFTYPIQNKGKLDLSQAFLNNLAANNIALEFSNRRGLTKESLTNFGPRVGFAYSANPATVLRGGFGMFYQGQQAVGVGPDIATNYPFSFTDSFPRPTCDPSNPPCLSNGITLEHGFQDALDAGLSTFVSNPSLNGIDPTLKTNYAMDYNLTAQRAFTNNLVASLGYVGTTSRHMPIIFNPNETTALAAPGVSLQKFLPFPSFGGFNVIYNTGMSSYNALQTKLQKRMSNGLDFLATYVWGHSLDDAADPLAGGLGYRDTNIIPIRDEYTNSPWDTRQRFTFNGYYQVPYGIGRAHAFNSRAVDALLGGWAGSLTFQAQTGQPFTVGVSNTTLASGGSKRAMIVRDPMQPGGSPDPTNPSITCPAKVRTLQHWFNPCAFRNPEPGTNIAKGQFVSGAAAIPFLGGRGNTVYGPGYTRLDMSLFKSFHTFREQHVEVRVDAFNVLNTPSYGNPSANDGQSGGLITGARVQQSFTPNARFFQLSAKYVF